jgi:hypothetical protein
VNASFGRWQWEWGAVQDGILLRSGVANSRFTGNIISNWAHNASNIEAISGTGTVIGNILARNTMTFRPGWGYGRAMGWDGAADGRATGNYFLSNTIEGQPTTSQFNGNVNHAIGNVWKAGQLNTVIGKTHLSTYVNFYAYAGTSKNNRLMNNTFHGNVYTPCVVFEKDNLSAVMSGHTVQNNIFHTCGGTSNALYQNVAFALGDGTNVGSQIIRNNMFYQSSNVFYKASGAVSVSSFQAACSGDTCTNNQGTDPLFVGITDFRLQAASPARNAGLWWGNECADVRGRPCFPGRIDIGAYQKSGGDPAGTRAPRY